VRLRDETWAAEETGGSLAGKPLCIDKMHVAFLERGPLVVTVQVAYCSCLWILGAGRRGRSFYRVKITLQAGQPPILIEEDSDMDVRWTLDAGTVLRPDQARYQDATRPRGISGTRAARQSNTSKRPVQSSK
jgi:hypothetical protein